MGYFLYILRSEVMETYYIGSSEDPERRLHFHNHDSKGYTCSYRPWQLVYSKEFRAKSKAMAAERKVKSWKSKKMTRLLVDGSIEIEHYL